MMNTQEKVAFETGLYNDFPHVSIDGRIFSLLRDADMGKIAPADAQAELERLSKTIPIGMTRFLNWPIPRIILSACREDLKRHNTIFQ